MISESPHPALAVVDDSGKTVGLISPDAVRGSILDQGLADLAVAADVMTRPQGIEMGHDLHEVLHAFLVSGMSVLPVYKTAGGVAEHVGVITQIDVTRAYDHAIDERLTATTTSEPPQ